MLNLPFGEHHRRLRARGAVHAQAGLLGAPQPGPVLGVGQIGEVLETLWFRWRLGLLDFDQGLVGPFRSVEDGFELCGR